LKPKVAAALALVAALGLASAEVSSQPQGPPTCTGAERADVLRTEQAAVLRRLGPLRTLSDPSDIAKLQRPPHNYVYLSHRFASFEGVGLTIIRPAPLGVPRAGVPNLVFYAPRGGADATDAGGPDFPYELAGWGYGMPYTPGRIPPILPCTDSKRDWHIHERGVHTIEDGGFVAMPPAETYYGEAEGSYTDPPAMDPVPGWPHTRSWTIHLWLNGTGVPDSAPLNPNEEIPGIDSGVGIDFYFPEVPPKD
jgi:hypothetical protein